MHAWHMAMCCIIGNTSLIPRTTCDTEHKLWFQIGNEKVCLPMTTEYTTNTLHVEYNGTTYSAGRLELFYEATVFNSCQSVSLPRGRYCVDLLGGSGGDGGNNSGSGVAATDEKNKCFEISETTTASVFRGGDGNSGSFNSNGNVRSGGGGGASGVPSLIAFGDTVLVSTGGAGGAAQRNSSSKNGGTGGNNTTYTCGGTSLVSYGGGGGGAVGTQYLGAVDLNGGDGGSGSTGTSSSSYVRIYRFE